LSKRELTDPDSKSLDSTTANRAICVCDEKGTILSCNTARQTNWELLGQDIIGQNLSHLCHNTDVTPETLASGLQIARKDGCWDKECTVVQKDGSRLQAKLEIVALLDGVAYPARYLAIIDASIGQRTPIPTLGSPLSSSSAGSEGSAFLARAAHDLRTPLGALQLLIKATLEQIRIDDDESPTPALSNSMLSARLDSMMKQADEMASLVRCLASLSLIDSNVLDARFEETDLSNVTTAAIQRLAGLARLAHSEIVLHATGSLSGQWRRNLLEDAIFYVIRSAIRSGTNRSIEVRVGTDDAKAWISVEASGVGVSDTRGAAMFDRDLGLWTAREIARALGGSIGIDDSGGGGAIVTIYMPAKTP
jgi:signal transduction histidine kinase